MSNKDIELSKVLGRTDENTSKIDDVHHQLVFSQNIVDEALGKAIVESREELSLKKTVSYFTMAILTFELVVITVLMVLMGANKLTYPTETINIYIGSVIGQIIITFYVMVKFLFDPNRPSTMQIVQNMVAHRYGSNCYNDNAEDTNIEVPTIPNPPDY